MEIYLKSIVKQLRNYSLTLDRTTLFVDKPWALIDEDFEIQRLIFKRDKELILSKNGRAQIGKWDYFPEAKSLLINRGPNDSILCNEAFIDQGVLVLHLDGTDNKFYVLANENIVKDLDAIKYLKELRYQKLKIVGRPLADGRILEIQDGDDVYKEIGKNVSIDANQIEDGRYHLSTEKKCFDIKNGKVFKVLFEKSYINPTNDEITLFQDNSWEISYGDEVYMYSKPVKDGLINFSLKDNLVVRNGKVIRIESKNPIIRFLSKKWRQFWNIYKE